jgi:TonB family protein
VSIASIVLAFLLAQRVHVADSAGTAGDITLPEVLYYTNPFYTRAAREKKIEGTVTVLGAFDARGCMKVIRTIKTIGFGLDENALGALRSWRFSPAKRNGEFVDAIAQIDIDFSLAAAPRAEYDDIQSTNIPGISPPTVIKRVEPQYTAEARQARAAGTVILQAVIQTDGTADILKVIKPLPYGLTETAIEAIRQWRFRPANRYGKVIPVQMTIEVDFNLQEQRSQRDVCR